MHGITAMPEYVQEIRWPFSLPHDVRDPFTYDLSSYRDAFKKQSTRLFCSPEATKIKIISSGSESKSFDLLVDLSLQLTIRRSDIL